MTLKVLDRKSAHARSIAYWPPAHWCMLLYVRWQTQRRVLLSTINFHLSPHSHTQRPHKTPLATRVPGIEARCECFRHTKAVCMNLRGPVAHDRLPQLDSVYLSLSRPSLGQSRIHLVPVCVPTSCVNGDNSRRMKHEAVGIALEALESCVLFPD